MKVLVTFALSAEFAPWRRMRSFERIKERRIFIMRNGKDEVQAVLTGIGARGSNSDFAKLLRTADVCVASGLAGSLTGKHTVGTVLVAKAIKRENGEAIVNCDESLVKAAIACGATPANLFCTTNKIITLAPDKLRLGRIADAADMESFQLMDEARKHGIPAVAVRAVSDAADQSLPLDFNQAIDESGNLEWRQVLARVAACPRCLPQLVRFGWESSKAARKLAIFLDTYLKCLKVGADLQLSTRRMEVG